MKKYKVNGEMITLKEWKERLIDEVNATIGDLTENEEFSNIDDSGEVYLPWYFEVTTSRFAEKRPN